MTCHEPLPGLLPGSSVSSVPGLLPGSSVSSVPGLLPGSSVSSDLSECNSALAMMRRSWASMASASVSSRVNLPRRFRQCSAGEDSSCAAEGGKHVSRSCKKRQMRGLRCSPRRTASCIARNLQPPNRSPHRAQCAPALLRLSAVPSLMAAACSCAVATRCISSANLGLPCSLA